MGYNTSTFWVNKQVFSVILQAVLTYEQTTYKKLYLNKLKDTISQTRQSYIVTVNGTAGPNKVSQPLNWNSIRSSLTVIRIMTRISFCWLTN